MPFLEIKDIYKNFGKTEVLKGISFSLDEGEVISIIGSSGSGKTTLLTDIARMLSILGFRSCVIDERNEISAMCASMPAARPSSI